jgi:hypothetical protein
MSYEVTVRVRPVVVEVPKSSLESRDYSTPSKKNSRFFNHKSITPEQVLKAFNTRAFKRRQPDNVDLMVDFIAQSMARKEPISFVLYWGKGPRSNSGEPEAKTLDYLAALVDRVREIYQHGATVTLICTDTHAALNGHSPQSIRAYFDDIAVAARQRGFETRWLGELLRGVEIGPESDLEQPSPEMMSKLCASAMRWFKGEGTVEEGALRYYQLNMVEKRVVEFLFPRSIFVTFNGNGLRELFPASLPIFYMFSVRHGVSDKPWFLPAVLTPPTAPSTVCELVTSG